MKPWGVCAYVHMCVRVRRGGEGPEGPPSPNMRRRAGTTRCRGVLFTSHTVGEKVFAPQQRHTKNHKKTVLSRQGERDGG